MEPGTLRASPPFSAASLASSLGGANESGSLRPQHVIPSGLSIAHRLDSAIRIHEATAGIKPTAWSGRRNQPADRLCGAVHLRPNISGWRNHTMSKSMLVHQETDSIAGYDYGRSGVSRSPVSFVELRQLEETVGWRTEDAQVLQRHADLFRENAEHMVDSWRAAIGAQPHLAKWFFGPDGKPDDEYKAKVKKRFVQWVRELCFRPHDQAWLDYQEEIGLRHTPEKKNQTDGAQTPSFVPLRFLIAFGAVVTTTTQKFFVQAGVRGEELHKLEAAWTKAVQLHITLWSRPYVKEGLW
jgi:hypothetical protein